MIYYFNFIVGTVITLFFIYFGIISILEKEKRATYLAFVFSIGSSIIFFIIPLYILKDNHNYLVAIVSIFLLSLVILLIPVKVKIIRKNESPLKKYDERDTMFSRKELIPGTENFEDYYKRNPSNKKLDDRFRSKPGLLSKKAGLYDQFTFTASKATFNTIEQYGNLVESEPAEEKPENIDSHAITSFIKKWVQKLGVISVGFTEIKDYHVYSVKGRREKYGTPVKLNHKYAIVFTVEMDKNMMSYAPNGPTIMESAQQYLESGTIAVQIAEFIHGLGYKAQAHIDGNYSVVCPLVARDAGLGEIGRMGLLMTPELGPRVRIGVVTTNVPLITNTRKIDDSLIDFCESCKKCADVCPPKAIPFEGRKLKDGVNRWKINSEACYTYWCVIGTDCGRCMTVCPYSHPNNFIHNLVRLGIRFSPIFRKFALIMDDFFYGRIPPPKSITDTNTFDYFK